MTGVEYVVEPGDPRLDDYRQLNDQRFRRRFEGDAMFITEGYVAVDRLVESGHAVRSVLLAPSRLERFTHLDEFAASHVPVYVAERQVIAEVVGFDLHRGVIASAGRRPHPTVEVVVSSARRLAVLEGLNDAENLGAVARAARAFGFDAIVIDPSCTDPYSRRTVRVSMGEVLMLPIARASEAAWRALPALLRSSGVTTWAMTPAPDAEDLWSLEVPDRLAVWLGAEGPGLTAATLSAADRRVRIPIRVDVDSLNVGQAAAVTFARVTFADLTRTS